MNNKYYILRHGEALSNKKEIISCWPEKFHNPLTSRGKKQIEAVAKRLKGNPPSPRLRRARKIDLIFSSDLLRTRQTAEIIAKELKIKPRYDKKLREYNVGVFNGKPVVELGRFSASPEKRFRTKPPKGETYSDIKKRMYNFFKRIDKEYFKKNILIISHAVPLMLLQGKVRGFSNQEILKKYPKEKRIKVGEFRKLNF